ncbi:MAG: nucleoside triphosphate pyrophosphohydrolase [Clostridium sp.]
MKKYNKLVRDKIPEIIEADGKTCKYEIVTGEEKYKLLEEKIQEEVNEFLEDKNLEELADIMEVVFALANELGHSEYELVKKREYKNVERGGFKKGIVLTELKKIDLINEGSN